MLAAPPGVTAASTEPREAGPAEAPPTRQGGGRWAQQSLVWRLLLLFSASTAASAVSFGLFFLLVGGSRLGWVIIGLGLPLLAPWALRRRLRSPRAAANVYLLAGSLLILLVTWLSGAASSTAFPAFLVLPIGSVLLVPHRDARVWLGGSIVGLLAIYGLDELGYAPPSLVPAAYVSETRILTLLLGVSIAYAFSLLFQASYRRARQALESSNAGTVRSLRDLRAAGEDLRRAATALAGPGSDLPGAPTDATAAPPLAARPGDPDQAAEDDVATVDRDGLVPAMRREARRAQALTERAWRTVDGFVRSYESIGGEILSLSRRLGEVEKLASGVRALASRLDVFARHVGVQAAQTGPDAAAFKALSGSARALAKRVEADAEEIADTMTRVRAAGHEAATLAREGTGLHSVATPRLDAMGRSFASVVKLAERAAKVGEVVVDATVQHLSAIEAGLRDVAETATGAGPAAPDHRPEHATGSPPADRWTRLPRLFAGITVVSVTAAALFGGYGDVSHAALFATLGLVSMTAWLVPVPPRAQRWLGVLFLVATTVLIGAACWLSGGLSSPAFPGLVMLPVLGVSLFGRKVGALGAGLAMALGGAFWFAAKDGALPPVPFGESVWRGLNVGLEALFLVRLFQHSAWARDRVEMRSEGLHRVRARVEAATVELQAAATGLERATEPLRGDGEGEAALVRLMHTEAAEGEAHAHETQEAFADVMRRYEAIEEAIHRAYGEAMGLDEALRRIEDMAQDIDLLALQIALEAVRVGERGAVFRLLADEMTRLAAAARADTTEMAARLRGARDAVRRTMTLATEGGEQARAAGDAVRELAESFHGVCGLVERGADASQALADLADQQLRDLSRGLAGAV